MNTTKFAKVLLTLLFFSFIVFPTLSLSSADEYQIFYGNLHAHTSFSDGKGTPEEAYEHASNYADVQAVTDHCYFLKIPVNGQSKTSLTQEAARTSTVKGKFVGLQGFEWTAGSGHINVYETLEFISRDEKGDLKDFYEWIVKVKKLAQFNHPGMTFGNFNNFWFWPEADNYVNLVEIGNGNWSSSDIISEEMYRNYILALNRGWHLSPTANQDNHKPNWASANDGRTGILAKELTYEDVMEALWSRRTFASEDKNVKIYFYANGAVMGSILNSSKDSQVEISVFYSDKNDPVGKMYIVSQSKTYEVKDVQGKDEFEYRNSFEIPDGFEWYFIYILQKDGNEIVSAPVWFEAESGIRVNYVRVGPEKPNVSQSVSVSFDIYNTKNTAESGKLRILVDDSEVYTEDISLPSYGIIYDKSIDLGKFTEGTHKVEFLFNDVNIQSISFEVSKKAGFSILFDKLHENDLSDELLRAIQTLSNAGNIVSFSETMLKDYDVDYVIIPTPSAEGLSFFKDLMPDEIEWLNKMGEKVYLVKGSDEEYFNIYKEALPSARVFESAIELLKAFGISQDSKTIEQLRNVVFIDQGHSNDYSKDKLTLFDKFLKSTGYDVQYINTIDSLDGKYLIVMNGKGYSDEEIKNIVEFVRKGGTLVITSKSDYSNGGNTEDLNLILDAMNSPVRFNDDQVVDEINNYGANYKVLAENVRFYSTCSLLIYGNANILISSESANSVDSDGKDDAQPVDKVVLAASFKFGDGEVILLGKAVFSDYDFELNKEFVQKIFRGAIEK
ncbi:DUF4350 domain-containing protein [Fervidobacterium gondwanense]|uniref:DUF4350 domain-containing protein n=1 Tax=Fervidobacterium gondwanense DSM 13020 TaxID=1121883 RepID=A0A1M7S4X4_FERGO|nr:DUF4350 domain-containing protein [Fervidobacterium gondwanense]SHN53375.1 hypothetical protein SAMN02745226_00470 [Fervidobacterium gondwanense DSM 13020]